MSRVCGSVYAQGSITGLVAPLPARFGFSPGCACCQSHHSRSMLAWCIQKIGSAGAVGTADIVPPTQTCTPPCTPSRFVVKLAKSAIPSIVGMFDASVASQDCGPGERVTAIGAIGGGLGTGGAAL